MERKLDSQAAHLLFKVVATRNGKSSTATGTNIEFYAWAADLGDAPLAMALLDRVLDRAVLLNGNNACAARIFSALPVSTVISTRRVRRSPGSTQATDACVPCSRACAAKQSKSRSSFAANLRRNVWFCFACHQGGDQLTAALLTGIVRSLETEIGSV